MKQDKDKQSNKQIRDRTFTINTCEAIGYRISRLIGLVSYQSARGGRGRKGRSREGERRGKDRQEAERVQWRDKDKDRNSTIQNLYQ